jgi:hypothetical protein
MRRLDERPDQVSSRPEGVGWGGVVGGAGGLGLLLNLILLPTLMGCPGELGPGFPPVGGSGTGGAGNPGTGGSSMTGSGGAPANCADVPTTLKTSCVNSACHSTALAAAWQDFESDGVAGRLIGKKALVSPTCNNQTMLVNAARPVSGVLIERLATTTCTRQMPPTDGTNMNPLPPGNFLDCVKAWLDPMLTN